MIKIKSQLPKHELVDAIEEETIVTYSHLASYFFSSESADDNQIPLYDFSSYLEESVYETGYLIKTFLKC